MFLIHYLNLVIFPSVYAATCFPRLMFPHLSHKPSTLFSFKENSRNEGSLCVTTKINICHCQQARNILFFINFHCFPRSPAWCWPQQALSSMLFLNCVSHPWREYLKTMFDLHSPHVENLRINFGFKFRHRLSLTESKKKLIAVCN